MKILVGYKRVVDYNVRIQVKPDGSGVVTDGVKLSPNPFDDIALEEALRLRDKGLATEVVVATIAPADAQAHLRNGLAMGANRAIHVVTAAAVQPLTAARAAAQADREGTARAGHPRQAGHRRRLQPDRADARDAVGPAAGDLRQQARGHGDKATVTREVDAGLETLEVDLPAVVTTDLRLNEPRFIKLPDIMKAKSKPLETLQLADLGVEDGNHLTTTAYAPPPKRTKGVMVKDVAELVAMLKAKGLAYNPEIEMSKVLIVAEHLDGKLNSATARCVTCAKAFNAEGIDIVVLSDAPDAVAAQAASIDGVGKVLTSPTPPMRTRSRRCWRRRWPRSPPATRTCSARARPSART
jgi:electron transfer flavoprotein beta subunit